MSARTSPPATHPHGFDLLRILAASLVVLSHSWLLPTGAEPVPLGFSDYGFTWGRLGVVVFFVASGYLIAGSWIRRPDVRVFLEKRARRIWPALAVMVLVVALVVGPLISTAPGYLTSGETWSFVARNLAIFPYDYRLPGVFAENPTPDVNGVLWTLGLEVLAYLLLLVAGLLGIVRRPWALLAVTVVLALGGWNWFHSTLVLDGRLQGMTSRTALLACFFAGATLRSFDRPVRWPWAAGAGVVLLGAGVLDVPLSVLIVPCGALIVVWAGTRALPRAAAITRLGDPSYGMYIWGFVLQQALIAAGMRDAPVLAFLGVSLATTLAAGYASWHLVERRAMSPRRADAVPVADAGAGTAGAVPAAPGARPAPRPASGSGAPGRAGGPRAHP
ncbi:acyltransferase, partial [Patulibacter sp. NPDC049589]|uniref:acyltransferase family protein n=1 Tax=Patulibacter sp. NPDC049589 TaxID=3154731 RepID=UPI003419AB9D